MRSFRAKNRDASRPDKKFRTNRQILQIRASQIADKPDAQAGWAIRACVSSLRGCSQCIRRKRLLPTSTNVKDDAMNSARRRFKVYYGPESEATAATIAAHKPAAQSVTVPLGEVLPLLADA